MTREQLQKAYQKGIIDEKELEQALAELDAPKEGTCQGCQGSVLLQPDCPRCGTVQS